jgi:hypothetical protein
MKEEFLRLVTGKLGAEKFSLLDIGCSGGIDPVWRLFEPRLQALGIDASETECCRLTEQERNPHVSYVSAFISGGQPFDISMNRRITALHKRLSYTWFREIRRKPSGATRMADPQRAIVACDLLAERSWDCLDYLKIDVDGPDFQILKSFEDWFDALGILCVQVEVNFSGAGEPDEHSFHNTDRLLRQHGFDLFRLDNRTYSMRALPACFAITEPAQTVGGRVVQGDAYYARDPIATGRSLTAVQLLKLAAVLSAWNLPDCSAEILLNWRERFGSLVDVNYALDLLAAQAQVGEDSILSYRDYMAEFATQAPRFFPPPNVAISKPTFWSRVRAAHAAYWDWYYADSVERTRKKLRR